MRLEWECTGCFFSTDDGELRSYENPKNKITAVPATEEEIWGAKYMVILVTHLLKYYSYSYSMDLNWLTAPLIHCYGAFGKHSVGCSTR